MNIKTPKKILISGGWGYGNLGDDAILVSTIKLVKEKYPSSELVVMTYNIHETKKSIEIENIKYVLSVHHYLVGNLANKIFNVLNISKKHGYKYPFSKVFFIKIINKLTKTINKSLINRAEKDAYEKYLRVLKNPTILPNYNDFLNVDLFILAGGGYFNDGWVDNIYSHVVELFIANKLGIKSLVIGQSIGPFQTKEIQDIAMLGLKSANIVSVRDIESLEELESSGISPVLIPDTALSETEFSFAKKPVITLVFGGMGLKNMQIAQISNSIEKICKKESLSVTIVLSRLWVDDLWVSYKVYNALIKKNDNVKLLVPKSYNELQEVLGSSKIVISQNLHGLILAWRAGVPSISLNAGRKFKTFMNQSGQNNLLLPVDKLTEIKLTNLISSTISDNAELSEKIKFLSSEVKLKFNNCLDNVVLK